MKTYFKQRLSASIARLNTYENIIKQVSLGTAVELHKKIQGELKYQARLTIDACKILNHDDLQELYLNDSLDVDAMIETLGDHGFLKITKYYTSHKFIIKKRWGSATHDFVPSLN